MEKRTPLYNSHLARGGKIVPFAGYSLPVQYSGIIAEHNAVRAQAGMFDVSHMGELLIEGPDAVDALQTIITNDISKMRDNQIKYSPVCYETGGTVDDILIYRQSQSRYLLVVNASNKDKDAAWIAEHLKGSATLTDVSDDYAQIALQGPKSESILKALAPNCPMPGYYYFDQGEVAGVKCLLSRTGYTGEDGFEFYTSPQDAEKLFNALLDTGDVTPCGLGARNTLRLEAAMPLYGHELSPDITPIEAGLSMFVKLSKSDFIGKSALSTAPKRKKIGIIITGKGIAREEAVVTQNGREIGFVTSGTHSPMLKEAIAIALVDIGADFSESPEVEIIVRGKPISAKVVPLPFYKREK